MTSKVLAISATLVQAPSPKVCRRVGTEKGLLRTYNGCASEYSHIQRSSTDQTVSLMYITNLANIVHSYEYMVNSTNRCRHTIAAANNKMSKYSIASTFYIVPLYNYTINPNAHHLRTPAPSLQRSPTARRVVH
jgi:hypothetical protein